jgi:hypothetical protein
MKLFVSFILCSITFAFIISKKEIPEATVTGNANISQENKIHLTKNEQEKWLNYLKYAKSSIYDCTSSYANNVTYLMHETGVDIMDTEFGNGSMVKYCRKGIDNSGYVIKGLIPNTEQLNDTLFLWHVKPRIRIDKETAKKNPLVEVCKIEIHNFEGEMIESVYLLARDFLNFRKDTEDGYYYHGEYKEEFSDNILDGNLSVKGSALIHGQGKKNKSKCKVDYRIYWLGKCDMWAEHIKVENDVADRLFKGEFDVWINAMDSIRTDRLENLNLENNQRRCIEYISNKINNNFYFLNH